MKIAVLSDTHERLSKAIVKALDPAEEIWHLGDVTAPEILAPLEALGKPLYVVRGNCDSNPDWPWTIDFEREGFHIRLIHIPPSTPPPGVDLLFHGHTHIPRDEEQNGIRFLNPGSAGRANKGAPPSFAWLELERDLPVQWEIVPL